jgi:hypothetical protein
MAKTANKALVVATLLSVVALPALSRDNHGEAGNDQGQNDHARHEVLAPVENYHSRRDVSAPEIDPAQALGALALLSGTVAIIRGYRRKK